MIKPDGSNEVLNPTQPFDDDNSQTNNPADSSKDTNVDDYKDMILEMHRYSKSRKASYNWNNI